MPQIRRTKYLFFYIDDVPFPDITLLLQGQVIVKPVKQLYALSILQGEEYPLTHDELQVLFEIPSDNWVSALETSKKWHVDQEKLFDFARKGLLLIDEGDALFADLRKRDEQLSSTQWNVYAALYHFMTKWRDVHVKANISDDPREWESSNMGSGEPIRVFRDLYGDPPDGFYAVPNPLEVFELPVIRRDDGLYGILSRRKTTRALDRDSPLALEELSLILYYTFGCHGYLPVAEDVVALKRTSPSGGSLHPTEVYTLIMNVTGLDPGVYHYHLKNHALELMISLSQEQAVEWADEFTAGQTYPRWAQALFIMTSRFYRNFWKYRKHHKAYGVLLMDAAHLSQTFYLVCTELGLGSFITAAINSTNIEQKLGLDGVIEGAIAICGCGKPIQEHVIDPGFRPYIPRETEL